MVWPVLNICSSCIRSTIVEGYWYKHFIAGTVYTVMRRSWREPVTISRSSSRRSAVRSLSLIFTQCLQVKNLVSAAKNLSRAQRSLSDHLINFKVKMWLILLMYFLFSLTVSGQTRRTMSWSSRGVWRSLEDWSRKFEDHDWAVVESLSEYITRAIEDERSRMLERAFDNFIVPLEIFRKDQVITFIFFILIAIRYLKVTYVVILFHPI